MIEIIRAICYLCDFTIYISFRAGQGFTPLKTPSSVLELCVPCGEHSARPRALYTVRVRAGFRISGIVRI